MRRTSWIVLVGVAVASGGCGGDDDGDSASFDAAVEADARPRPDAAPRPDAEPAACPDAFVPNALAGMVVGQNGARAGLHIDLANANLVTVAYSETTEVDTDFPLSAVLQLPNVGAGYHVDIISRSAERAFIASAGTLRFTTACMAGATGTLTDVTLVEVDQTSGMPKAGGCTQVLPSPTTFVFGDACPTLSVP